MGQNLAPRLVLEGELEIVAQMKRRKKDKREQKAKKKDDNDDVNMKVDGKLLVADLGTEEDFGAVC